MNFCPWPRNWNNFDAPGEPHPKGRFTHILAGSHGTQLALRRFPVESIDFLNAGVANQQRRFVRGEAGPVSEGSSSRLKSFHAEEALQFMAGDLHAVVALLVVKNPVKIQMARVSRPSRVGYENPGELRPLLSG